MFKCVYDCGTYREDLDLVICRPQGELTADRMYDVAICRECIYKRGLLQANRFHDLTAVTSVNLGFSEMAELCNRETAIRGASSRIVAAYLVDNPLIYGTVRMYQQCIEKSGVEVYVSYDFIALAKVLQVDPSVLTAGPRGGYASSLRKTPHEEP